MAALLAVELLDELVDGAWTTAWPLVRADLHLSYVQVGVLLAVPPIVGNLVEPVFGVLGDAWDRRVLVRAGGAAFALALLLAALSQGFAPLLAALVLFNPAGGAFVGLSQATLMDAEPGRREHNMARWALAGSVGVMAGPLLVAAATRAGPGWRAALVLLAVAAALLLALTWRVPHGAPAAERAGAGLRSLGSALAAGARDGARALRRGAVVRWLVLLELSNLMLDVLHGFLALYVVDVAGAGDWWAGVAIVVWAGAGLAGDALLIPLLRRVSGVRWLRVSALAALAVYPAFLLVPALGAKLVLLGVLALLRAGWYAILKGRLYGTTPGRSATVLAVANVAGLAGSLLPLALGMAAERWGLGAAMWLLLAAPVALVLGLPREAVRTSVSAESPIAGP